MMIRRSSVVHTELSNDSRCVRNASCLRKDSISSYDSTRQSILRTCHIVCQGGQYDLRTFKDHYFWFISVLSPVNAPSKQKNAMRRVRRKPRGLNVRRQAAPMIKLTKYLAVFPGAKSSDKICEMELDYILLNSMPKIWNRQLYVQSFDCESITFK